MALNRINMANPRSETTSMPINFQVILVSRHFLRRAPVSVLDEQVMPNNEKCSLLQVVTSGWDMCGSNRGGLNGKGCLLSHGIIVK
jgi:hypothetical protein